jgi:TonB family protein
MNSALSFRRLVGTATGFVVVLLIVGSCLAQTTWRESDRESEELELTQHSLNLRMLSIIAAQKRRPQKFNSERAISQVQEDFTRIQQINKPLGLMALGKSILDLKFVTRATTEINKRAERLKANLALPGSPKPPAVHGEYLIENSDQLKTPIVDLARLVLDFTSNPFFKETGVVGPDEFQARRDLEDIIEISSSLRELSKRLSESHTAEQTPQDPGREEKIALAALRRQEIPEATLPCGPEEAKWWEEIRALGYKVKKSRDQDGEKFLQLLKEGQEKSFQAPIPNRGPTFLRKSPPEYTEEARRMKLSGGIAMVVEFLQDGTVGEVKIVQGLGFGLDENAAKAARRSIFLPAVKDARFVTVRVPMTLSFSIR